MSLLKVNYAESSFIFFLVTLKISTIIMKVILKILGVKLQEDLHFLGVISIKNVFGCM